MSFWDEFDASRYRGFDESYVDQMVLPESAGPSFLRYYSQYAKYVTHAHATYHPIVGLTMLSVLVPQDVKLETTGSLRANFYSALVGPSGEGKKSWSIRLAIDHNDGVFPAREKLLPMPGSAEYLEDAVIKEPQKLLYVLEGGRFLRATANEAYRDGIRKMMAEAYDCAALSRETIGKQRARGSTTAAIQWEPRLSFTMALTKPDIEASTDQEDWKGGFISRICFAYAENCREYNNDEAGDLYQSRKDYRDQLIGHLARLAQVGKVGRCRGLSATAKQIYSAWSGEINRFKKTLPETARSSISRAEQHALKAALLTAYDRFTFPLVQGAVDQKDAVATMEWEIAESDLRCGLAVANVHIASALHLAKDIAKTADGRLMRQILSLVGDKVIATLKIVAELQLKYKEVDALVQTLEFRKELASVCGNGSYRMLRRTSPPTDSELDAFATTYADLPTGTSTLGLPQEPGEVARRLRTS